MCKPIETCCHSRSNPFQGRNTTRLLLSLALLRLLDHLSRTTSFQTQTSQIAIRPRPQSLEPYHHTCPSPFVAFACKARLAGRLGVLPFGEEPPYPTLRVGPYHDFGDSSHRWKPGVPSDVLAWMSRLTRCEFLGNLALAPLLGLS